MGILAYSHSVSSFQEVIKEKVRGGEPTAVHLLELQKPGLAFGVTGSRGCTSNMQLCCVCPFCEDMDILLGFVLVPRHGDHCDCNWECRNKNMNGYEGLHSAC